jgi:hypothetical protein
MHSQLHLWLLFQFLPDRLIAWGIAKFTRIHHL